MKIQQNDHDDFERQDGSQRTSDKIKDLFEFEVNEQYDGGDADGTAAEGDGYQRDGPSKRLTGGDR